MSQAYRAQYGFNSTVLYPVNLYGPRDNSDLRTSHVIPAMLRKFHEAKQNGDSEVVLWGDGFFRIAVPHVVLAERHGAKLRVRAHGAEPDELANAHLVRFMKKLRAHHHVLVEKTARIFPVRPDAAHLGGEVNDQRGPAIGKKTAHGSAVDEIVVLLSRHEDLLDTARA